MYKEICVNTEIQLQGNDFDLIKGISVIRMSLYNVIVLP